MSSSPAPAAARLLQCLHSVAPRSKHGVSHPFHTVIAGVPILTGDAVYRQRPLLEVIYQYHRDYIFQVKANNKKTPEQFPLIFPVSKSGNRTTKHVFRSAALGIGRS